MTVGGVIRLVLFLTFGIPSLGRADGQPDTTNFYRHVKSIASLNSSTFDSAIFNKDFATIVMLYSGTCGGCAAFAPKWTNFAENVKEWKRYVQVAAINCDPPREQPTCRANGLVGYPTVRFYGYRSSGPNDGVTVSELFSYSDRLPLLLAKYMTEDWNKKKPFGWPNLDFVPVFEREPEFLSPWAEYMAVIIQRIEDTTGAAIAFDISNQYQVEARFLEYSHPFNRRNGMPPNTQLPALVIKRRHSTQPLFSSTVPMSRESILDTISRTTNMTNPLDSIRPLSPTVPPVNRRESADPNKIFVHATDLKSGLAYMLRYEVPMRKTIEAEAKLALSQFLHNLAKYLPLERTLIYMIKELGAFVDTSPDPLLSDAFIEKYDELQREYRYPFPNDTTWVACKGSIPGYRGFPCSVWMLFHLLTVQAYISDAHLSNFNPVAVPWSIHLYVKHFFGCRTCAENFGRNAQKMRDFIHDKTDGVLWLWKSHNRATYFLKGHVTEDPEFPKNQFPYKEICPNCFNANGSYNEPMVFTFLLRFYSDIKTFDPQVVDAEYYAIGSSAYGKGFSSRRHGRLA